MQDFLTGVLFLIVVMVPCIAALTVKLQSRE